MTDVRLEYLKAQDRLSEALLRPALRVAEKTTVWKDLYYSPTPRNAAKFAEAQPELALHLAAEIEAVRRLAAAAAVARQAAQQQKQERKAQRASATKPGRSPSPCAATHPVAAANYDQLSAIFAQHREQFAHKALAVALTAAGGRVVANVDEAAVLADARLSFDRYLAKLAVKINARVLSGDLSGSIWSGSTLVVQTEAGEQEWFTRTIINQSVRGRLFHQWPTRRIR